MNAQWKVLNVRQAALPIWSFVITFYFCPESLYSTVHTLLEKRGSKIVLRLSSWENPFWFLVEPLLVPVGTLGFYMKGFYMEPKRVLPGTKRVYLEAKWVVQKVILWGQPKKPFGSR